MERDPPGTHALPRRGDVVVTRALPEDWLAWRDLRLASLRADPDAFGSAWERERDFDQSDWRERLATSYAVLAHRDGTAVGMGALITLRPGVSCVVAMWTTPAARGAGVGRRVLATVLGAAPGGDRVLLWVADGNPARSLYESSGFVLTGVREPIRPGATLMKSEMVLRA